MSNMLYIEKTEFKNVTTGEVALGVIVADSYGSAYNNTWEEFPENDLDVLKKCMTEDSNMKELITSYIESNDEYEDRNINICGTRYEWEEIKHLFEE